MKTLEELDLTGKRVFVRVDFNVPTDDQGTITDDTRIRAHLPTIAYIIEKRGKAILASHLGRPKGKKVEKYSLKARCKKAERSALQRCDFCRVTASVRKRKMQWPAMKEGDVLLLENLRFYPGEEKNDKEFARQLAESLRRLCRRCLCNGAQGPCIERGHHGIREDVCRGHAAQERARLLEARHREPRSAACGHNRRR